MVINYSRDAKTPFSANITLVYFIYTRIIMTIISTNFDYVYLCSFLAGWAIAMLSMDLDPSS